MLTFCKRYRIGSRCQSGKLKLCPEKTTELVVEISRDLGKHKIGFENGEFNEMDVECVDETHFIFHMTDDKTLGFTNDEHVRYVDVTSGSEGMTTLLRLS